MDKKRKIGIFLYILTIAAFFLLFVPNQYVRGLSFVFICLIGWIEYLIDPNGRVFSYGRGGFWSNSSKKTAAIFFTGGMILYFTSVLI